MEVDNSQADAFIRFAQFYMLKSDQTDEEAATRFFTKLKGRVDVHIWPEAQTPQMLATRFFQIT